MRKYIAIALILTAANASAAFPSRSHQLYQDAAIGCVDVNLKTWQHPTKKVLQKYQVNIQRVQLCNNKKYPVFIGESKYALETQPNQTYARNFAFDLLNANAGWDYAFVDTASQYIMYVSRTKAGVLHIDSDFY